MNRQTNHLQPLALPRTKVVGENAFAGDLLFRKKLAERLTGYVDRLRVGAVLAIDAPWGEGKTWFGRNWAKHLETESHKVIFIDAFALDYVEDPFLLIAAEIADILDDENKTTQKLRERAADVMKAILPVGTKVLINLAGRVALGSANLSEDIHEAGKAAYEGAADSTDKWIKKKLEDHTHEKVSIEHFKDELTKFSSSQDKPVVIFIDELDRCRPTFGVQLIERIKHFFDVPNLVIVLLLNRKQLENAIKGVYGSETEAETYLGKFVHLFLKLPKNISRDLNSHGHPTPVFIKDVLNRYDFSTSQATLVKQFTDDFSQWVVATNMSLRDIERGCALFVMSNAVQTGFIAYLITLKIKYPTLYEGLLRNDTAAHKQAISLIQPLIHNKDPIEMNWPDNYFKCIQELHQLQLGADLTTDAPSFKKHGGQLFGWRGFCINTTFSNAFDLIDLPVENY